MRTKEQVIQGKGFKNPMDLHQGDCVRLNTEEEIYQVIGVDDKHDKCWLRRWPLLPNGSPVFEASLDQITLSSKDFRRCPVSTP